MAGGKGGSQTTTVEVPEYIEEAAKRNLARADRISRIGYTPYYGPDVAAFTPLQEASMQNLAGAAGAFGLVTPAGGPMSGMPQATTFGGVRGYSSGDLYDAAIDELARRRPAQKSYIDSLFIDPYAGTMGANVAPLVDYSSLGTLEDIREAERQNAIDVAAATAAPSTSINVAGATVGDIDAGVGDIDAAYTVTDRPEFVSNIYQPETDPYGPTINISNVLDASNEMTTEPITITNQETGETINVMPPAVPAAGGTAPVVGDVIDNAALEAAQNAVVEEAFDNFGAVLQAGQAGILTPEQVAAANPAFNAEIALANAATPVTVEAPQGSYTVPAGSLGSADFAAATGATYTPPATPSDLGTFTGGGTGVNTSSLTGTTTPYSSVEDLAEQYSMAGQSAAAAGIRNIGGAYAQSPAGSGELVETRYNPETGQSEIISVSPSADQIAAEAAMGLDPFGGAGPTVGAEETFGADLFRSLTDPSYDPEGTVLSRALDNLSGSTPAVTPPASQPSSDDGPSVIQTGVPIASGTVFNKADDPIVVYDGKQMNQSQADQLAQAKSESAVPLEAFGGAGDDDVGPSSSSDDGCVIATHAVSSGGFTPSMKREAVVWCMNVLHDKWWGEAIRRGYRYLGRKKIEQGKAHEHYAEFRDYIAFANGKKRTLKGAINFMFRTAQFFAVGLVKKDA